MQLYHFLTEDELAYQLEQTLHHMAYRKQNIIRGFLPTGQSAQLLYKKMIGRRNFWIDRLQPIQIDEFISPKRLFYEQLYSNLLHPLQLEKKCESIQPEWSEQEFSQHIEQTIEKPIDFAVLGFGPNGHIGFHEPHIQQMKYFGGKVKLSDESFQRVQNAPSQDVYTFGASSFAYAKEIFLIVTGKNKQETFERFVKEAPNSNLPASLLKYHPQLHVLTTFATIV